MADPAARSAPRLVPEPGEETGCCRRPEAPPPALRSAAAEAEGLEFSSRGDRVRIRLLRPRVEGPAPLLLVMAGSADDPALETGAPWLKAGACVASLDGPLGGRRASAKLSRRLEESAPWTPGTGPGPREAALWETALEQAVLDLRRALAVLTPHPWIADGPVATAGLGPGPGGAAVWLAASLEPRCLAVAAEGLATGGPEHLDPAGAPALAGGARRLWIQGGAVDPRAQARLEEALPEGAVRERLDVHGADRPAEALGRMGPFLLASLGLAPGT